ncbi:hypothetical protein AGMMS50267_03270 [Spirochaetia bacterium]|nr:hypothetical protein AGMMS50267_03270 [Spirochaetia bacterium]
MKKKTVFMGGALLLIAAIFLTSCGDPSTESETGDSELTAAITAAEKASVYVISEDGTDVPPAFYWTTGENAPLFEAALADAKALAANPAADQTAVNAAVVELKGLTPKPGSASGLNYEEFYNDLEAGAREIVADLTSSENGSDVLVENFWVTPEKLSAFEALLDELWNNDNVSARASQLAAALIEFKAQIKPGTYVIYELTSLTIGGVNALGLTTVAVATDDATIAVEATATNGRLEYDAVLTGFPDGGTFVVEIKLFGNDEQLANTWSITIKKLPRDRPYTIGDNTFELRFIPAGAFQYTDGEAADVSRVTKNYWMANYETTRSLWNEIWMGSDGYNARWSSTRYPAGGLAYYHVIAFLNKLSLRADLTPVYSVPGITDWEALQYSAIPALEGAGNEAGQPDPENWALVTWNKDADGFRLPTEAEFDLAYLGSDASPFLDASGVIRPGSEDYTEFWPGKELGYSYIESVVSKPADSAFQVVGTRRPNALGLYDMGGNIIELVWDRVGTRPTGERIDYSGAERVSATGQIQMSKGGAFNQTDVQIKTLYNPDETHNPQYGRYSVIGFRIAQNN